MYKYPYGDSQQLNLDWVLTKLKELEASGGSGGADLEEVSNALISLTYNTSTAYRRYDYAFRNGKLYRCLTDTSGVFNPTAWQEALIGDDLAVLTRWINAIDAAAVVDVKFDTSGTNGKIQQKYHDQYHDVVEVDYTPVQNSKRPLSSNAGYELNGAINAITPLDAVPTQNSTKGITSNAVYNVVAFEPYQLPDGNVTTLDYFKTNITRNGIWRKYVYLPAYNLEGWTKIVAFVSGTYKKIYLTQDCYEAFLGTDDGVTWSDLKVTPILTHSYDTNVSLQSTFISALETAFTNASNYSIFYGGSGAGNEGGWCCFKHATTAIGIFMNYVAGVCVLRRDANGTWTAKTIFK